jgi:hypothetical protein
MDDIQAMEVFGSRVGKHDGRVKRQLEIVRVEKLYTDEIFEHPRIARALVEIAEYFEMRLAQLQVQEKQKEHTEGIGKLVFA